MVCVCSHLRRVTHCAARLTNHNHSWLLLLATSPSRPLVFSPHLSPLLALALSSCPLACTRSIAHSLTSTRCFPLLSVRNQVPPFDAPSESLPFPSTLPHTTLPSPPLPSPLPAASPPPPLHSLLLPLLPPPTLPPPSSHTRDDRRATDTTRGLRQPIGAVRLKRQLNTHQPQASMR